MATSVPCHARSISLPSSPHPIKPQFDVYLCRLRSSESASTSTSSSSITHKLNSLKDLYECVDDLLLLPSNVRTLSQDSQATEEILDRSVSFLDACGGARDALAHIKVRVQDIQSGLRRRCGGDLSAAAKEAAANYMKCRKEVKKEMTNLLKDVRNVQKKCTTYLHNNSGNTMIIADTLMELEFATAEVLTSLLAYVTGSTKRRLPLISKLIHQGQKESNNDFEETDVIVQSMINLKKFDVALLENVQVQMGNLELIIQDFDQVLESLVRRFIKTRANLLNIISN